MKYDVDTEGTLYEELEKKRKKFKKWGWRLLWISFGVLVIVASIFEYALQIPLGTHIAGRICGWFFLACFTTSIILWFRARHYSKLLMHVCPMCLNELGVVMEKNLIGEEGYEVQETKYKEVGGSNVYGGYADYNDYDKTKVYEKETTRTEYITDETYDVVYKCPSCKHVWRLTESEMTYKKRTK